MLDIMEGKIVMVLEKVDTKKYYVCVGQID
jgi:hypothetical protein